MPESHPRLSEYLTIGQAAEYLGVSVWTLRNWDKDGRLKSGRHPKNGYRIYRAEDLHAVLGSSELPSAHATGKTLAPPRIDWSSLGGGDGDGGMHFVQFYESDEFLADAVSDFISHALDAGHGTAMVIATPEHRMAIERKLATQGVDLAKRRYRAFDAAETLSKLMVGDAPDPKRFKEIIGGALREAEGRHGNRQIRAFGEMVALLWRAGNRSGAVQLEALWNELARTQSFTLLCGYPMRGFCSDADGAAPAFADVCACHSRVIPAESYVALPTTDQQLRAISRLQHRSQRLEEVNRSLHGEIEARKLGETALARLGAIVESSDDAIVGKTLEGVITSWNKGAQHIFGFSPEEAIGSSIFMIVPPDRHDEEVSILQRLRRGERIEHFRTQRVTRDGRIIDIALTVSPIRDVLDNIIGASKIARDITEQKRHEAEREKLLEAERHARAQACRLNRMKDEFLATLSHELRTPLNAILGWAQLLASGTMDAQESREACRVIERNARTQKQLIEDLLDMSRIISGKMRLDVQRLDPVTVIEAAIATIKPSAHLKGVRIERSLDPVSGVMISGDAARLQQVIWNILANGVKFTPAGGTIRVQGRAVNGHVELTISDTGQGIDPDFLPQLFERFRQADASTTRKHGGLGLGLAIVKQLVELHGGTVRAHSEGEGKGATFMIQLPRLQARFGDAGEGGQGLAEAGARDALTRDSMGGGGGGGDAALPPLERSDLSSVKVLLVEDEPDACEMVERVLVECGAEVCAVGSAAEALQVLGADDESRLPDVLVSDIGMPQTDGYELLRQVRQLPDSRAARIPAIALTAFARSEDRTRALRAGYVAHVPKPLEPSELLATIAVVAGRAGQLV
jgi:PAS domain S-box-containing protein/excisionase family DNA binding protein